MLFSAQTAKAARGAFTLGICLSPGPQHPLLTCGAYGNVVRVVPALVVTAEQIDDGVRIWSEAVAAAAS